MLKIDKIVDQITEKVGKIKVDIALILGSGWNNCVDKLEVVSEISYKDIEGMPSCSVQGHNGKLLFCKYLNKNIAVMQGRFHLYEGYDAFETTIGLQVLQKLGAKICILTNASGGINESYKVNDIVIINDVINMTGRNPLVGLMPTETQPVFISMGDCMDKELIDIALSACDKNEINHHLGVYVQNLGPSYETSAEIKMLRVLGADCVGMSTVQEVIMARYLNMKVLALANITNMAQGVTDSVLSHNDVLDNAKKVNETCSNLILEILSNINI